MPTTAAPTMARLLRSLFRDGTTRLPTGSLLSAERHGRTFVTIDVDRFGLDLPFPADVIAVGREISEHLGWLALYRRDVPVGFSRWNDSGSLYAPAGCAAELLGVLLALDAGDTGPARAVADMIQAADQTLQCGPSRTARRMAAVGLVEHLEREIPAALDASGCR